MHIRKKIEDKPYFYGHAQDFYELKTACVIKRDVRNIACVVEIERWVRLPGSEFRIGAKFLLKTRHTGSVLPLKKQLSDSSRHASMM